jgi:hypothetical protein
MYQNFLTNTVRLTPLAVVLLLCPVGHTAVREREVVHLGVAQGHGITVDGELASGEWDDAGVVTIEVTPNWKVSIRYKYDRENLYFAFSGLKRDTQILYPEVLIDSRNPRNESWSPGVWWFHASNNLCEADGAHDVYRLNGVFQCSHTKPGWSANIPPSDNGVVEFRISLSKISLTPDVGTKIGLAFDVTNATGNDQQGWSFWPANAKLGVPNTWAEAVLTRSNARVSNFRPTRRDEMDGAVGVEWCAPKAGALPKLRSPLHGKQLRTRGPTIQDLSSVPEPVRGSRIEGANPHSAWDQL